MHVQDPDNSEETELIEMAKADLRRVKKKQHAFEEEVTSILPSFLSPNYVTCINITSIFASAASAVSDCCAKCSTS